jgi:hypothetical protein
MQTKITFLALIFSVFSFAQVGIGFTADGIKYKITAATTVEVSENQTSLAGAIVIPETVFYNSLNYQVTSIGTKAFQICTSLTAVSIPKSVTSIGDSAFAFCDSLTSITIPNSVTSIGKSAFSYCGLTSITIPTSITSIAAETFSSCSDLASVSIPTAVTSIGDYAFYNCHRLTSVKVDWTTPLTIPSTVFSGLDLSTKTLYVPAGTSTAYKSALVWKEFSPITEPPVLGLSFKVNGINYYVTKAILPYEAEVGNNQYFVGTASIPTTVSSNGNSFTVTAIANSAFLNCSGLTAVTIPNTVTYIGDSAFESCRLLKTVIIPTSITSIGNHTFNDCQILTAVTIPTSVTTIGRSAFQGCLKLKSVTIPNSVTSIGDLAFYGCGALTSIIISNAVKSIGVSVFAHCNMLTSVSIPSSVTSIGSKAFQGCTSLTSVTIPNSVTTIGELAYELCSSLTSVTIPNLVTSIGIYAFGYCFNLSSVNVNWTTPLPTYRDVFNGLNLSKVTLNVPQGTEQAYRSALVWRDFGSFVTLSTNQFSLNTPVKFYPNPTQSQINFAQEIKTLDVFDIAGKKVKSLQNPSTNYDVANLQKGVYILKGKTTDGKSVNEKLVKE